ncbi:hypothetical protein AYO48_02160 [Gaiella sp. SCGC AG-212-M14]|nr:hypothetical protein AYO48_02160 [Gaiella sp. SCGC AG-212-M14]
MIGARSNNRAGVAGICWRCLVMPIKVLDSKGNGDDTLITAGIVWAVNHGARVLNLSLGGPGSSVELGNALTYAANKGGSSSRRRVTRASRRSSSLPLTRTR